ncbi:hypothetical protein B9Z55_015411 [Caenorhabditis nigoni]|uniref:Uncharacterized protein n=1 Tax=Caenorhabditis nigoni TaxID=1611254 RepID=A0A2G5UAC6_9PELO|nr:hypothetical protein B9Z55_015411 [Caenorhabditis nigoni]
MNGFLILQFCVDYESKHGRVPDWSTDPRHIYRAALLPRVLHGGAKNDAMEIQQTLAGWKIGDCGMYFRRQLDGQHNKGFVGLALRAVHPELAHFEDQSHVVTAETKVIHKEVRLLDFFKYLTMSLMVNVQSFIYSQ